MTAMYIETNDDLLADIAPGAIAHMNADHPDALLAYVQAFGGAAWATSAQLLALNRYGMTLAAEAAERREQVWVSFEPPLTDARQLRLTVVNMARNARAILSTKQRDEANRR